MPSGINLFADAGPIQYPVVCRIVGRGFSSAQIWQKLSLLIPPFDFCCETSRPQKITTLFQKQQGVMNSEHRPRINDTI